MRALPFSSFLSIFLCSLMAVMPVWGQTPDALQIRIVNPESLNAVNHVSDTESLVVEVTDASGTGVGNAAVTCRLPDSGATGTFADGSHATVAYTDSKGRASLDSFRWAPVAGHVAVRVTASKGTAHTGILLEATVADAGPPQPATLTRTVVPVSVAPPAVSVAAPAANAVSPTATAADSEPTVSVTVPGKANTAAAAQPGQLASQAPIAHSAASDVAATPVDPTVSVTKTGAVDAPHNSHVKWIIIAAVIAAAGAGAALAMRGKSSSSSSSSSSAVSIGNPTVSVGGQN